MIHKYFLLSIISLLLSACGGSKGSHSDGDASVDASPQQVDNKAPNITTTDDPIEEALRTGNALLVDSGTTLLNAALETIEQNKAKYLSAKNHIFNLNSDGSAKSDDSSLTAISWDPSHDAALLTNSYGINDAILTTNGVYTDGYTIKNKTLGVIGLTEQGRYMVLGSNPMRTEDRGFTINDQMQQFLENSLSWLTNNKDLKSTPFNVVIAQLDQSQYFPDNNTVRSWLDTHYPSQLSYNANNTCDGTKLAACLAAKPDLLIVSQQLLNGQDPTAITNTIAKAMDNGTPVLYMHLDGGMNTLGHSLFPLFNISYDVDNYWQKLGLKNYSNTDNQLPHDIEAIQTTLTHLRDQDYAFSWGDCDTSSDCASKVSDYNSEFAQGASAVRSMFNQYDVNKTNIFAKPGFRLQKLLALTGDKLRQSAVFPMDKISTDDNTFLSSYFADHAVYNYRTVNPIQPDMGNFSRSDFSHITPTNKAIDLVSKKHSRAAGVYALPGQTFTVTRTDTSTVNTTVFINTLRDSATHEFNGNGYNRPKYLKTPSFTIAPGETLTITPTYGGPIQIGFNASDQAVSFNFSQVGEHPFWAETADNAAFELALATGDYDWAELTTSSFEVHSKLEKMRSSMANANWGNASALAAATMQYTHDAVLTLAGYKGFNISVVPEIHDFAINRGWTINSTDQVKHMNADQPTCGAGCSGNPYDASWSFSPVGHGDLHEVGHGIEKGRFRFAGWDGHASTNPYSYYAKSKFFKNTGKDPGCQSLPFDSMFNTLQQSYKELDPSAYMQSQNLNSWSQGIAIYIQMMMSVQAEGVLNDGWHLLSRLHMLEREFGRAVNNDNTWQAKRNNLGFSNFTRADAMSLNENDWLVIALSYVGERDFRDFLMMWGLSHGTEASNQVASFGFSALPRTYYDSGNTDYCKGLDKPPIAIVDSDDDGVLDAFDAFPGNPNESSDADGDGIGDNVDTEYNLDPAELLYQDVEITSLQNSLCLGIDNSAHLLAQPMRTISCSQDTNTQWSWGKDGRIHAKADYSYCVSAANLGSGAQLSLKVCADDDTQKWEYISQTQSIKDKANNALAFDKYGNNNVNLYTFHGSSNQRWSIVE